MALEDQKIRADTSLIESKGIDVSKKKTKVKYPKHVFLIVGNEFCERFSYYGMRTVLVLYARNFLQFDEDTSTVVFHAFTFLAYFFPLVGGIIADSYWGKYKTILYLSFLYVLGHVVKTIAAIPYIPSNAAHITLSVFGLLFIAVGTGGIKPCVSSFGGDQFHPSQERYISQFFAMFYFSINAGALLSKFVTPMFRADMDCYPGMSGHLYDECYAMAFGIPGLLMLVALVFFIAGTKYYTNVPLKGSVFWKFCKCVYSALSNKWKSRNSEHAKEKHWVDYAQASDVMKQDTKYVLRILLLFTPLPFFWALFDQQGSRWTFQALHLDGYWGKMLIKPDQMDVVNPLLIITLIPVCEFGFYPLLRFFKINFSPLRKMTAGLLLAGLSFILTAILQFNIDNGITPLPAADQFSVRVINMAPCDVTIMSSNVNFDSLTVKRTEVSRTNELFFPVDDPLTFRFETCAGNGDVINRTVTGRGEMIDVMIFGTEGQSVAESVIPTKRLENGMATVRFLNADEGKEYSVMSVGEKLRAPPGIRSDPLEVPKGLSPFMVTDNITNLPVLNGSYEAKPAGVYTIVLEGGNFYQLTDINPNTINIAWMIPQYLVLTIGEVFLSITGLEFSYTQAPPSMKAVVSSFWLLTVAFGNLIVLVIAEVSLIERQAHEFILFAALIFVAAVIFIFLAKRYKVVKDNEFVKDNSDTSDEAKLNEETNGETRQSNSTEI